MTKDIITDMSNISYLRSIIGNIIFIIIRILCKPIKACLPRGGRGPFRWGGSQYSITSFQLHSIFYKSLSFSTSSHLRVDPLRAIDLPPLWYLMCSACVLKAHRLLITLLSLFPSSWCITQSWVKQASFSKTCLAMR